MTEIATLKVGDKYAIYLLFHSSLSLQFFRKPWQKDVYVIDGF